MWTECISLTLISFYGKGFEIINEAVRHTIFQYFFTFLINNPRMAMN